MLNTESRLARSLIWLAILGLVTQFFWSYFAWPAPDGVVSNLLASDLANFIARNQTVVSGLLGFGGLTLAYLLNGWRDRTERRHVIERAERRDAGVLAREAGELATTCEQAARALAGRGSTAATVSGLRASVAMRDHMLLATPAADLARLGAGASAAARSVRSSVARLVDSVEANGKDDPASARAIATRALEVSFAAKEAHRVFDALARSGPQTADRLRMMPLPETSDIERMLSPVEDSGLTPRLLPAA